jgi:hypothetical protein
LRAVQLGADRAARLQFRTDDCTWCVVVDEGRVEQLDLGVVDDPDVVVHWSRSDASAILRGELRDDDAWRATTVSAMTATGLYTGPPAPVNLACRPELDLLPKIPGASLCAQFRFPAGPFGAVRYALRFHDGRVVDEFLGERDDVDVRIEFTYRNMALARAGEITIIDALHGGSVIGEIGALMALGGIAESPEYQRAERATGRHAIALSVLGELNMDEEFRAALQDLVESSGAV